MSVDNLPPRDLFVRAMTESIVNNDFSSLDMELFSFVFSEDKNRKGIIKESILSYYDTVANPFEALKRIVGFSLVPETFSDEEKLMAIRGFDDKGFSLIERYNISLDSHRLLNSACALYMLGARNMADDLARIAGARIIREAFDEIFNILEIDDAVKEKISDINRKNASGPKKDIYDEVVNVMKLTWEKYPLASKNGMIEKLLHHFGSDKVSRSTLNRWIKECKLGPQEIARPPVSFSLVFQS